MQHACVRATPEKARLTTPVRGGEILAVRASLDWSSEFSSDNAREVLFNGRTTYVATSSPPRQKADDNEGDAWQLQCATTRICSSGNGHSNEGYGYRKHKQGNNSSVIM